MENKTKKRGRKPKDEYYMTKKIDNVNIENEAIIINLPIDISSIQKDYKIEESGTVSAFNSCDSYHASSFEKIKCNTTNNEKPLFKNENKTYYSTSLLPKEVNSNEIKSIKTDLYCFWCCHPFETDAVFMPIKLEKDVFKVKNVFCSYECCYSFMSDNPRYTTHLYLLKFMLFKQTGLPVYKMKTLKAKPREKLKIFGGNLSIEEFRENNVKYNFMQYPVSYVSDIIEEISPTIINENSSLVLDIKSTKKLNESKFSLDKFIKIKNK